MNLALTLRSRARAQEIMARFRKGECQWCQRERTKIVINRRNDAVCFDCRNRDFARSCSIAKENLARMKDGGSFGVENELYLIRNPKGVMVGLGNIDAWYFISPEGPRKCPHCEAVLNPWLSVEARRQEVEACRGPGDHNACP
jgi:hypothetical protein